jgi:hypothetical protein
MTLLTGAIHRALSTHHTHCGQIPPNVINEIAHTIDQRWTTGDRSWQMADTAVTDALDSESVIQENLGRPHTAGPREIAAVVSAIDTELSKLGMRFTVSTAQDRMLRSDV